MIDFILHEVELVTHFIHANHVFLPFFVPIIAIILISIAKFSIIPNKIQSIIELIYEFLEDQIKGLFHNEKDYKRWMPLFLSLFFYILFHNLFGLIPGVHPLTSNVYITGSLAILIIIISILIGIKRKGPIGFFVGMTPKGVMWPIRVMMFPIEAASLISKPFSLAVRLYANMFAGHMVILSLLSLTEIFHSVLIVPLDIIVVTMILFFELMVSFIQAFIFAYLSAIYITDTMYEGH